MASSFSGNVKAELCRSFPQKHCCALSECFGILLFCNSFSADGIRIITESREFAHILPKLFRKAFSITFDVLPEDEISPKQTFQITDKKKLSVIMRDYGFDPDDTLSLHINLPVVEDECCKTAFFRGAFLAGGSVTDPAKAYHMEFATNHRSVAREAYTFLHEVLGFYPKCTQRAGGQVLYLKNSELISDCLTFLGAPISAMGIMEARLEKELNNKVNRRCNCDEANTSKVVEAAQEQLSAIRILRQRGVVDTLPAKLMQALIAREQNPDASLTELSTMMDPPISKPAMNHRLKKLVQMSKE